MGPAITASRLASQRLVVSTEAGHVGELIAAKIPVDKDAEGMMPYGLFIRAGQRLLVLQEEVLLYNDYQKWVQHIATCNNLFDMEEDPYVAAEYGFQTRLKDAADPQDDVGIRDEKLLMEVQRKSLAQILAKLRKDAASLSLTILSAAACVAVPPPSWSTTTAVPSLSKCKDALPHKI